jgi:arachidonate 15-lipoxygenase
MSLISTIAQMPNLFPIIPQKSNDPDVRSQRISHATQRYEWDYSWPPETATPKELHKDDSYNLKYIARALVLNRDLVENHQAVESRLEHETGFDHKKHLRDLTALFQGGEHKLTDILFNSAEVYYEDASPKTRVAREEDFYQYFQKIDAPPIVKRLKRDPTEDDRLFAWQRVAGANPMMIQCVTELPPKFPVIEAHFQRAGIANDSLAAALAEGRALICDYTLLDGVPSGYTRGLQKWVGAPIALFVADKSDPKRRLRPVAIQIYQRPSEEDPIFTPADGWKWKMAKNAVRVADGNMHEGYHHLGQTHLMIGVCLVSLYNTLSEDHPLRVLMKPHGEFTLAINESAKNSLIARDGIVDKVTGSTIDVTAGLVGKAVTDFEIPKGAPPMELDARRLMDRGALPEMPYRDDALLIWGAIHDYVRAYCGVYYGSDDEVGGDYEVKAWFDEMSSPTGGRLNGLRHPNTIAELAQWVATIVFYATAQHAVVNFGQCPFMGPVPNMPGAAFAPPVNSKTANTERAYLDMLPPRDIATLTSDTVYQLSSIRENILGHYSALHFRDPKARGVVKAFRNRLADIEHEIAERDAQRLLTFPFLLPSLIPNSIHI